MGETADEIVDRSIKWLDSKAAASERTSRWLTTVIAIASAAIPVLLVMSTRWLGFFLGKVLPAILGAVVVLLTTMLSVMRPLERWRLYRTYQRILQVERFRFQQKLNPYNQEHEETRKADFLENLARLHLDLHDQWAGLVPKSTEASEDARTKPS